MISVQIRNGFKSGGFFGSKAGYRRQNLGIHFFRSSPTVLGFSLVFQTPGEGGIWTPKNIPIKHQTSGGMTGRLGLVDHKLLA